MFKLLDVKDLLKLGAVCIFAVLCFLCYHFYSVTVEQTKQIQLIENSLNEKKAVIEKLTNDVREKIKDIENLNGQFTSIESKYKAKITELLNQMKPTEDSTKESETLIFIFNQTLSDISKISGEQQK